MTTIDDLGPRRPAPPGGGRRPRRAIVPALLRWPIGLLLMLLVLAAWRYGDSRAGADAAPSTAAAAGAVATSLRSSGAASVPVPREWVTLDRGEAHVTWGTPDRRHTVTLASTEASLLPLPGVVAELVEQSAQQLPDAELLDAPRPIELEQPHPRGDSAMLARFRVAHPQGDGRLDVVQVWRRDARAGLDVVATWTSADGSWPLSPRRAIPQAEDSR